MKLNKRILAILLVFAIAFLSFSLPSISIEYFRHTHTCNCDQSHCTICIMYNFVSNFYNKLIISLIISLFVIYTKSYCSKCESRDFKLLPIELKVRMND